MVYWAIVPHVMIASGVALSPAARRITAPARTPAPPRLMGGCIYTKPDWDICPWYGRV